MHRHVDNKIHLGDSVVEMSDYKPHVVIQGLERVHVISMQTIQNVANRKLVWSKIEDSDDMIPAILQEWLKFIRRNT